MKKTVCRIVALVAVASMPLLAGCSAQSRAEGGSAVSIERNGHRYLVFEFPSKFGASVIHDPDCPCGKAK